MTKGQEKRKAMDVTEQIWAVESSLLELIMKKNVGVDFRRLTNRERKYLLFGMNGKWERQNVFLKSQRCLIFIKQETMSSADFRRMLFFIYFFLFVFLLFVLWRVMQYIVTMRKKRKILFNFWLVEKKYKNISNQRKRGREGKVEVWITWWVRAAPCWGMNREERDERRGRQNPIVVVGA